MGWNISFFGKEERSFERNENGVRRGLYKTGAPDWLPERVVGGKWKGYDQYEVVALLNLKLVTFHIEIIFCTRRTTTNKTKNFNKV